MSIMWRPKGCCRYPGSRSALLTQSSRQDPERRGKDFFGANFCEKKQNPTPHGNVVIIMVITMSVPGNHAKSFMSRCFSPGAADGGAVPEPRPHPRGCSGPWWVLGKGAGHPPAVLPCLPAANSRATYGDPEGQSCPACRRPTPVLPAEILEPELQEEDRG